MLVLDSRQAIQRTTRCNISIMDNSRKTQLIYLLSSSVILLFLYCGLFAVPSADDYFYANIIKEYGTWKAQVVHYIEWSGRYAATFLITLFSLTRYEYYWLVPMFCILSLLGSLYIFLRIFFNESVDQKTPRIISLAFVALFLSVTTAGYGHGILVINEGFYWFAGAITYIGSLSLFLLFLTSLTCLYRRRFVLLNYLICAVLLFVIIGLNETVMFLICIGIFPLLLYLRKQFGYFTLISFTLIIAVSCSLVVFAPGNEVRAGTSDGGSILAGLGICVEKIVQIFFYYLFNPFIWLFVLALNNELSQIMKSITSLISRKVFFIAGALIVYLLYFPVAYSLNSGAPDRLVAFIGFFALIMSIFYAHSLLPWLVVKFRAKRNFIAITVLASILGAYFFVEPLRIAAVTAFTGPEFFALHQQRKEQLVSASKRGEKNVIVDFIERNPLLLFEDLLPGKNEQVARFYELSSVTVRPKEGEK